MGGNISIFDSQHLVDVFALDPFGDDGRGSNGGSAAEGFELGVFDIAICIYFDLELLGFINQMLEHLRVKYFRDLFSWFKTYLHYITARRRADKSLRRWKNNCKEGRIK